MRYVRMTESGTADVLMLAEALVPDVDAGQILIHVKAAGVNRPDILQREGIYLPPEGASPILGLEVAGEVVQLGEGVTDFAVGERVCALTNGGGYADYVSVPASQCLPVPDSFSDVEAASLPETYFTVWSNVFIRAGLRAGESFLIHGGSSGIGVAAVQIAKALGATVYATAGSTEKCQACIKLGADAAVNYKQEDFVAVLKARTQGRGVDVIMDMVGGEYLSKNIRLAAEDARIVNIAYQAGMKATVNFGPMLIKRVSLLASTLRAQSEERKAEIAAGLRRQVWPMLGQSIFPVVDSVFPIERVAEAHRRMESGEHIGKIILDFSSDH